jgi:hypothetical protein
VSIGATKATANKSPAPNSICGNGAGLVIADKKAVADTMTVCSEYLSALSNVILAVGIQKPVVTYDMCST